MATPRGAPAHVDDVPEQRRRATAAPLAVLAFAAVVMAAVVLLTGPRRPDTGLFFGQDLRIYYDAAREAAAGGDPYLPYDIGTSFLYHPFSLTTISSVSWMGFTAATWSWVLISVVAWVATVALVRMALRGLPELAGRRRDIDLVCVALLAMGPVLQSFFLGQVNTVVALATLGAFVASERRRPWLAGAALALAIILKTAPVVLVAYFLVTRRWKELAATAVALAAATGVAALQFGGSIVGDWLSIQRRVGDEPMPDYPNESFISVVPRALGRLTGGDASRGAADLLLAADKLLLLAAVVALVLAGLRARRTAAGRMSLFAAFLAVSVLFSPLLWYHHVTLLALPLSLLLLHRRLPLAAAGALALALVQLQPVLYRVGILVELGMVAAHLLVLAGCAALVVEATRRTEAAA